MNNQPHIVVVGVKDKQPSALKFASEAAIARRARLRVIHCLDVRTAGDFVSVPHDTWRSAGEDILDDARITLEHCDPAPATEYVLDTGLPYYTLHEEAKTAQMVVVGVDAVGWANRLFGGSVTERLATHSPAPVAIIPERSWPAPEFDRAGAVFVAIDARGPSTGPLRFAFEEASRRNNELHVIHVVPVGDMFHATVPHRVDVSEALAGWSEQYPDVKVTRRLLFDTAEEGCVRASEDADLLILGRHHDSVIPLPFGHPVLAEITRRVHCPCVVVPNDWTGKE